ncbi:MAG: hypothetical protein LDL41_09885 [Coleofasciculus sp. S288]|nr:hypothetical protein [Coleofasciculus sp. S288]
MTGYATTLNQPVYAEVLFLAREAQLLIHKVRILDDETLILDDEPFILDNESDDTRE